MEIYIARQPILNRKRKVIAYELLFRENLKNKCAENIKYDYTKKLISNMMTIGTDTLIGDKKAFINFSRENLLSDLEEILSPDKFIIEILEDVELDDILVEKCKVLKNKGYTIAIDDFEYGKNIDKILPYIDIIKVDFLLNTKEERAAVASAYKKKGKKLLAEKIESKKEYQEALEAGYDYFQGYFFSKPSIVKDYDVEIEKQTYMALIEEFSKAVVDVEILEAALKFDLGLSYKLLRYANKFINKTTENIISVDQAIEVLGIDEIKKWLYLIIFSEVNIIDEIDRENIVLRAKFCENIATYNNIKYSKEVFLVSMFITINPILEKKVSDSLVKFSVDESLTKTLLEHSVEISSLINLALYYEANNEKMVRLFCTKLDLKYKYLSLAYIDALQWVKEIKNKIK